MTRLKHELINEVPVRSFLCPCYIDLQDLRLLAPKNETACPFYFDLRVHITIYSNKYVRTGMLYLL